ncbi:MAG: hypothetical protein SFX73_25505 [Kofleriaceae bacterium]|nr:hypothetical protein [Kofleriaceae bacterium]
MKSCSVVAVVLALSSLSLGCKDKKQAAPATASGSGSAAKAVPPAPALSALPAECEAYHAAIDKLAECNALPLATRDALKKSYDAAAQRWAAVPPDGRAALGNTCKEGADAINKTLASCK